MHLWISWHVLQTANNFLCCLDALRTGIRRQATNRGLAELRALWGPAHPGLHSPSSSYPLCITGAITVFIKSTLLQCLSIQLTLRLPVMWHVERVWWLRATISCFWKGLLCILTSMNKRRTFQKWLLSVLLLPVGSKSSNYEPCMPPEHGLAHLLSYPAFTAAA